MQKKCEMYWPENVETPVEYGDVTVSLVEVERFGDYVQRTMRIRYLVNNVMVIERFRLNNYWPATETMDS